MRHRINTECSGATGTFEENGGRFCVSCDEYLEQAPRRADPAWLIAVGSNLGLRPTIAQRIRLALWRVKRRLTPSAAR